MSSNPTPHLPLTTEPEQSDIAIRVQSLSKSYQIYARPEDRLKQSIFPRLQRLAGKTPKSYFREFWALKDVSFDVKKGETVGIIGRNGSGKSTLLQLICGTLTPTSGSVETHGRIAAMLELGSGFNPEFTGRENVYMNAAVLGLSKEEVDARFDDIAAFADIGEFIEQPVKTYSSGMFVRLAFAIQANVDPEILIVDEALAVGDAYFVHRCMQRFHELRDKQVTILVVSHDGSAVKRLCDRGLWLEHGQVHAYGSSGEVVDAYLAALFEHPVVSVNDHTSQESSEGASTCALKKEEGKISADLPIYESHIPNLDRRLGTQELMILGVAVYDEQLNPIASINGGDSVILRVSFKNVSLRKDVKLAVGYILRDPRGIEIASTNSVVERVDLGSSMQDEIVTVRYVIKLPVFYSGPYAFCPTIGYLGEQREIVLGDRVDNAIAVELTSGFEVHALMRLDTMITREV